LAAAWVLSYAGIIIGCAAALAVSYCALGTVAATFLGRPRVEIGPDGFVTRGVVGNRARRWSDVAGSFTVIRAGLEAVVAYRLTDAFKEGRIKLGSLPAGYDESISFCEELVLGAAELAEVLNQRKDGFRGTTP
jgi:hypothetical protein